MAKNRHKTLPQAASPTKQSFPWKIAGWIICILLIILVIFVGARYWLQQKVIDTTETSQLDLSDLPTGDGVVKIVEFSDFECPFCGANYGSNAALISKFREIVPDWEPAYPKVKELVKQGKVIYEFKHFPLTIHKYAEKASEAAECAKDQGKFWEMHDMLFEHQGALKVPDLKTYAKNLGLDTAVFNTCLDSGIKEALIKKDMQEGLARGVTGTPTFFLGEDNFTLEGARPWPEFKAALQNLLNGKDADTPVVPSTPLAKPSSPPSSPPPEPPKELDMTLTENDHIKGSADAKVTIIEYSDFQCPYCGAYFGSNTDLINQFRKQYPTYEPAYPLILKEYVETGKVKYVFRNNPLVSIHPRAKPAAMAAECAGDQGKFWEMHDLLFENQKALSDDDFKKYAGQLSLDKEQFSSCYDSGKYSNMIDQVVEKMTSLGVTGTPTLAINGKIVSGAYPFESFKKVIDASLAEQ